jgi:hypothetical protein
MAVTCESLQPGDKVWLYYEGGPRCKVSVLTVRRQTLDVEMGPGWTTLLGRRPVTVSRSTGVSASGREHIRPLRAAQR